MAFNFFARTDPNVSTFLRLESFIFLLSGLFIIPILERGFNCIIVGICKYLKAYVSLSWACILFTY